MKKALVSGLLLLSLVTIGSCSPSGQDSAAVQPLVTGAIPDQDPEELQRLYSRLSDYLEAELGVPVEYRPVTDYAAAVTAFRVGDLDLVWFGGLTGVQARLQVEGAEAIAQRDIDEEFTSVFIANRNRGIPQAESIEELTALQGRTFTFGSESSTSGRLMPQYFLSQAGVNLTDFRGQVGFSGSHDATIELVTAGTYEAGVLNSQVWNSRVQEGRIDLQQVEVIFETPPYYDYHWVLHPNVRNRYGEDFPQRVQDALLKLDANNPDHAEILNLFGAAQFIPTQNANYAEIEAVGREIGKIR